jgi:hypothetical protein
MSTAAENECESCLRLSDDLVTVQRIYVRANEGDDSQVIVDPDLERWCVGCRTHYPHQVA